MLDDLGDLENGGGPVAAFQLLRYVWKWQCIPDRARKVEQDRAKKLKLMLASSFEGDPRAVVCLAAD